MNDETIRGHVLDTAKKLTEGDRNEVHGDPYPQFCTFAGLLTEYLSASLGADIHVKPHDAAMIMQLYKITRIAGNPTHRDSHFDNCAYGAIVAECVHRGSGGFNE